MALENEVDANFYTLIHQLAGSVVSDQGAERRDVRRQSFVATQRIAARRGDHVPDEPDFVEVRCQDLTRRGFSFLLPSRPDFDCLVAAFGSPPGEIYVAAEITHCCEVLVHPSGLVQRLEDGVSPADREDPADQAATMMVLVGCRFTRRMRK